MRLLLLVAGLALGAALAVVAVLVHRHAVFVGGVLVPWGVALSLGVALLCGWALVSVRPAVLGMAVGWTAVLVGLLPGGRGGDYVYMTDLRGWSLLVGGVGVGAVSTVAALAARTGGR